MSNKPNSAQTIARWLSHRPIGWNVDVLIFLSVFSLRPITTACVRTVGQVAPARQAFPTGPIATGVARQVATHIAVPPLAGRRAHGGWCIPAVAHAATMQTVLQHFDAGKNTKATNRASAQRGTTASPGVYAVSTTETFVGRDVALVKVNRPQTETARKPCHHVAGCRHRVVQAGLSDAPVPCKTASLSCPKPGAKRVMAPGVRLSLGTMPGTSNCNPSAVVIC